MTSVKQSTQPFAVTTGTMKKLMLSFLVVATFIAYAVRERLVGGDTSNLANAGTTAGAQQSNSSLQLSSASGSSAPLRNSSNALYKDGQFTGDTADAYWGNVEVQATIQGGKITDVQFLDYPHDRNTSRYINSQAMPWLTSEAVQAQNARVDIISGATLTSQAFIQSLQTALDRAKT